MFNFPPLSVPFSPFLLTLSALENEVLRNPKPSLVDRSVLDLSPNKLVPPDIYVDQALLKSRAGYDAVCEAGAGRHKLPRSDSPDSDMELVAGAKARIQELQEEAEILEEAYRNYQQRAVRSPVSHMLPPRALSPPKQVSHHSHMSKVAHRPLSPQTSRVPSSPPFNTKPPAQPRVTFLENQPQSTVFPDHSLHSLTEPVFLREDGSRSPSRRLSSTPRSSPRKRLQRDTPEGTNQK